MEREHSMNEDLGDLIKDFVHWKEAYLETHKSYWEMHGTLEILREELRIAKDLERSERYKENSMHDLLTQQQCIIDELLGVKDENVKLSSRVMDLESTCKELKLTLELNKKEHVEEIKNLKSLQLAETQDMVKKSNYEVMTVKQELEKNQMEYHHRYQEIANKLEALKTERDEQVNMLIAEYEGKLQTANELLVAGTIENKQLQERASANMSIYQKKLFELEKEKTSNFIRTYNTNQSSASHNLYQEYTQFKTNGRQVVHTKCTQNSSKSKTSLPQVNNKHQQNIKKYITANQNSLGMIHAHHNTQATIEDYSEELQENSSSTTRRSVAFPIIKKKKLFTPCNNTLLQP